MKLKILSFIILFCFTCISYGQEQKRTELKSVNFIQEGEVSKLILDFSNRVLAQKTHIKADKQIILDIKNVMAAKRLLRGIDTSEFSGSAVYVSPYMKPGKSSDLRFAIQLRDNARSFIENKDTKVILHIENRFGVFTRSKLKSVEGENVAATNTQNEDIAIPKSNSVNDIIENLTQAGVKRYVGRKISINVNNVPIREVIKMIGDTSGFNMIIEKEVESTGDLTISLTNLPWDQVLDTIMQLKDLVAKKFGNILIITTAKKAREEKKAELEKETQNKILEPLVTKIFPISYATLSDLEAVLKEYSSRERGNISIDKRTKSLIVKDTVNVIEKMKKIVEVLDTQTPQILISAKVVEVVESYNLSIGLSNGIGLEYDALADLNGGTFPADSANFALSTAPTATTSSILGATINVGRLSNLVFGLELMESESKGKVISSPKVIAQNGETATISTTIARRFIETSGATIDPATGNVSPGGTAPSDPVNATLDLTVTPTVTNEGAVIMTLALTKSSFGVRDTLDQVPPVTTSTINTKVLVDNGSTVVVGGVYQTDDQEVESGIPFLKDLPLIGWLFRSAYQPSKQRNELMIFLTPRIINQEEAGLVSREIGDELGI